MRTRRPGWRGTTRYGRVLADHVSDRRKIDLVMATAEGEVICLATQVPFNPLRTSLPMSAPPLPYRDGYMGVVVADATRHLLHITGRT